jgi:hypothetical protein
MLLETVTLRVGTGKPTVATDGRGDANSAVKAGLLSQERGDLGDVEEACRRADERGEPAAPSNLGVLLEQQGDLAGAEAAYRRTDGPGGANGALQLVRLPPQAATYLTQRQLVGARPRPGTTKSRTWRARRCSPSARADDHGVEERW